MLGDAGTPTAAKAASASQPASQRASGQEGAGPQVQRNLRTRLCLISKSNHHEDYQLARRLLPLHTCAAMMSTMTMASAAASFLCRKPQAHQLRHLIRACMRCCQPVSIFLLD